jgi:SAM-dependent methyltransferase
LTDHSEELIEHYSERLLRASGYSGEGFAAGYDSHRPSPPVALLDILCIEAQMERPRLVVDLGSGTGLSARAWADRADEVVGVEASPDMCAQAEAATATSRDTVRFVQAYAQETGLPAGVADVVTCSQSFHWMEPEPTLAEAARILRPGGVFAAYDYDWPPVVHWEVDAAFEELLLRVGRLRSGPRGRLRYSKEGHLERMRASGHFRHAREVVLHSRVPGSAERIVGMAMSLGPMVVLLQEGTSEEEIGLAALREAAVRALGEDEVEMFLGYRVRLGIK